MRFLRMLTNSLLAGGLGAAYLTVLVLQLNPELSIASVTALRWFLVLAITYGPALALAFFLLLVVREFFSIDRLSPAWASIRLLAWLAGASAAAGAALMWLNADAFRTTLGEAAFRRTLSGAVAVLLSGTVLIGIAIVHYSRGRRGGRVGGALFAIAAFGSLALPLAARGPAVARGRPVEWPLQAARPGDAREPRVLMLLLDGASLEYVRTRATEGRLPNLSRLLEEGASMYLETVRPTHAVPVWAAAATGMLPAKNGVRSAAHFYPLGGGRPAAVLPTYCGAQALVRLGIVRDEPVTSAAWHARPLWSILSNAGIASGIVRWPLTFPARPVSGFIITDRAAGRSPPQNPIDSAATYPPDVLAGAGGPIADAAARRAGAEDEPGVSAARTDRLYVRSMRELHARTAVRLTAVRLLAVDAAAHRHLEEGGSAPFRPDDQAERRANAQQIERAYAHVDAEIGVALDTLSPGDLLLVVSGFGMERSNRLDRLVARALGDPVLRGTHERAPDGFLLAYGSPVQPGRLPPGSIVDLTPTVLYFLGVPVGRDMDGFARTDLFTSEFTAGRPIAFISSHNH